MVERFINHVSRGGVLWISACKLLCYAMNLNVSFLKINQDRTFQKQFCVSLRRGLSTSIHFSAPRGLRSTYRFLYTNLKNSLLNGSYTYIDQKTCKKIYIYNCYVRARTHSHLVFSNFVRVTPGLYRAWFWGTFKMQ